MIPSKEHEKKNSFEVRLSQTLENVVVEQEDIQRIIKLQVRIHSCKENQEQQTIFISLKVDSTIQQLLNYIASIAQVAPNFLNIYYKKKRLANSDIIYKENITSDEKILCIQG